MNIHELDIDNITEEQLLSLKAQYEEGVNHLQYFNDTMKHFRFPEKRMKTFDTVHYERVIPQIKQILTHLGQLDTKIRTLKPLGRRL